MKKTGAIVLSLMLFSALAAWSAGSAEKAAGGLVNLTYSGWGSPNEKAVTQSAIDMFNKRNPDVRVAYLYIPSDYNTKLATLAAADQLPDAFMFYKTTTAKWGEQGKLLDLTALLSRDTEITESKLIPNALLRVGAGGNVVGMKICEEVFATYYNVDMFTQAGVAVPPATADKAWSWDEFVETAKKMTLDQNGNNATSPGFDAQNIKQYGVMFNRWMWSLFLDSNGTSLVTADKSRLNLTDPLVADAIQKLADLINVHHVAPTPTSEKNLPSAAVALQSRRAAMALDGQWIQLDLGASGMNFDVGVLPKLKAPSTVQFGEAIVISGQTKHKDASWRLLKWMVNPESSLEAYRSGLWMPIVKDWYTKPDLLDRWATVKPGHSAGFKTAVLDVLLRYGKNNYGYWLKNAEEIDWAIISPALDSVWLGKRSAAEAFAGAADQANQRFQGVYN